MDISDLEARFDTLADRGMAISHKTFSGSTGTGVNSQDAYQWATSVGTLVRAAFGPYSSQVSSFESCFDEFRGYASQFKNALGVFLGLRDDFKLGFARTYRKLVENEVNEEIIEQAESLLAGGYKDAACIVVGVALELDLRARCASANLETGKVDKMNADLARAGLYNLSMQKQITAWAGRRNDAAHGQWDRYTDGDVADMVRGVRRFLGS